MEPVVMEFVFELLYLSKCLGLSFFKTFCMNQTLKSLGTTNINDSGLTITLTSKNKNLIAKLNCNIY